MTEPDAYVDWKSQCVYLAENIKDPTGLQPVWFGPQPESVTNDEMGHPDDLAVDHFAAAMKAKLAKKRTEGRGGWDRKDECTAAFLSQLLREHVEKGDPVDVGNLAMMLQQRGERITK